MEHSRRSIVDHYDSLVSLGRIERDAKQMAVVQKLDALSVTLVESRLASKSSALGWLFGGAQGRDADAARRFTSGDRSGAARPC